jgi:hypothetical protein
VPGVEGAHVQLTLVGTQPQRGPIVATGDDLVVALDAAYDLLVASVTGDGRPRPQEQLQVWQGADQAGTRLGTLTILPDPADFEYRAADVGES